MSESIKNLAKTARKFYLHSHRGRKFLAMMIPQFAKAKKIRNQYEQEGSHIPPFLIASIAIQCNLHCVGCYARANGSCGDSVAAELSTREWERIFDEAVSLGISFVLLAGGEPFLRKDVIEVASSKRMVFPIFTNGTMLSEHLTLLDEHRNLIPVLSLEGEKTDVRRGVGMYDKVNEGMKALKEKDILFGVSLTVHKENIAEVTSLSFLQDLRAKGCGLLFYVEYIPVDKQSEYLCLDKQDIAYLSQVVDEYRDRISDMMILSFPGDEKAMGGCLASGRGFFHINASGGAEPCPFSPYATHNLKDCSLLDVLQSTYFKQLQDMASKVNHQGGCTLFQIEDEVETLKNRNML